MPDSILGSFWVSFPQTDPRSVCEKSKKLSRDQKGDNMGQILFIFFFVLGVMLEWYAIASLARLLLPIIIAVALLILIFATGGGDHK